VLSDEEREEGALLIDIADDGVSFALWKEGYLVDSRILDLGGKCLTRKIALEWGIDDRDAQKVKEQFGTLVDSQHFGEELIPLVERNGRGNQQVHRQAFQQKFLGYAEEWMDLILKEADAFAKDKRICHPHLVFTGGGTSVDGFIEFLQKRFSRTSRIGLTRKIEAANELLVDPSLSGGLGLLRWLDQNATEHRRMLAPQNLIEKTLASARDWFTTYF
jgi:cell division protein FtsA